MLTKLDRGQFSSIKDTAYDIITRYPLINAVISGIQTGYVYADYSGDSFFIVTKSGFCLFHTKNHTAHVGAEFLDFLKENQDIPNYIHLYSLNDSLERYITDVWNKHKIRKRAQFRYLQKDTTDDYRRLLPAGYRVTSVQQSDFERLERSFKLDLGNRYWNSKGEFLASAVGACILTEKDEPAAICYSACVVDGVAEMDTLVLPDHRGKRFMRFVSEPFFEMTVSKGLIAHWDTFVENAPSYVMAQKFELKLIQEYALLSLLLR